jgi:hypothetical protein
LAGGKLRPLLPATGKDGGQVEHRN